jgi:DNA polymerase III gamma/tau subunit
MVCLDRCLSGGHSLEQLCSSLIDYLRQLMVIRVCGAKTDLVDVPGPVRERLAGQAEQFDAAGFTYMIAVVEELRRSVRFSGSGRALTEAAMVRLASMERFSEVETLLANLGVAAGGGHGASAPARAAQPAPGGVQPGRMRPGGQTRPPTHGDRGPVQANRRPLGPGQDQSAGQRPVQDARVNYSTPVNREERRAALAEPLVRKAIELFDGELTNIEKEAIRGPVPPPEEPKA